MPNSDTAEVYFIVAMFILIFVISGVAVYIFFRTYRKEKRQRLKDTGEKRKGKNEKENVQK